MKIKNALSTFGNGLLDAAAAVSNASTQARLDEIDAEIKKLREERAEVAKRLI